jgi:hypothetical protein
MEHLSQNSQSGDKKKIQDTLDKTANRETEEAQNTSDRTTDQEKEESKEHLSQIRHSLDTGKHKTPQSENQLKGTGNYETSQSEQPVKRYRKAQNISK